MCHKMCSNDSECTAGNFQGEESDSAVAQHPEKSLCIYTTALKLCKIGMWLQEGGGGTIVFAQVIKKDIKIEVFYLKVWITLLNEMLHLLFMARRHLAGYFLLL